MSAYGMAKAAGAFGAAERLARCEDECKRQGAASEQVEAIREMYDRVIAWREANPERCKPPDVEPGELLE